MRVDRNKPRGYITKAKNSPAQENVSALYKYAVSKAKEVEDPRLPTLLSAKFGQEGTLRRLNIICKADVDREFDGSYVIRHRTFDGLYRNSAVKGK